MLNKDLRVDPQSIKKVLDSLGPPESTAADAKRSYDSSIVDAVNRDYASEPFPNDIHGS